MIDAIIAKISLFFDNLAIPFEMIEVYKSVTAIWDALPLALKAALIGIFGVSTFLCVVKMLF